MDPTDGSELLPFILAPARRQVDISSFSSLSFSFLFSVPDTSIVIMYSILFTILLASTYVSAIPMPLGALYELPPDNDAERTNKAAFTTSLTEANRQIGNMQEVLKNPNDPRIKTAFGPNANHAEISKVVNTLATKKLKVQSMDPDLADTEAGKQFPQKADKNGKYPVNAYVPMKGGAPQAAKFGSTFFGSNTKQQAGTIIHEATHQLAGTGDHVDPTTKRVIPGTESAPAHAVINGGYSASLDPPTAGTLGSKYENMRDTVSNTHQNADSYRVFASLCSRSLYKRALLEDDPVGYYLSKRSQCNLPPDYFAKKAAAKAAASKGTTTATKGTTSPTAANRKASTTKSTGVKGTKGGVKGASTRKATGATAGKGLKAVKSTKAAKSPKTAKGAKTAKGLKTVKAGKGLKAVKGAKAVKGVKAAKGAKTAKGTKAGTGVKVAKAVKAANGAKGTKGTGSSKSVKATKSTKSTASRNTASGAKTATRVATKTAGKASVKAAAPKAAVKVAAAVLKKGKILRRDLGMILDELD